VFVRPSVGPSHYCPIKTVQKITKSSLRAATKTSFCNKIPCSWVEFLLQRKRQRGIPFKKTLFYLYQLV